MRNLILILSSVIVTGCASLPGPQQEKMQAGNTPAELAVPVVYASAAALAFDPPITMDEPPINLSRSDRGPAAFVGFEQNTTSYYTIVSDNRQTTDFSDRFIRESFTERSGFTQR